MLVNRNYAVSLVCLLMGFPGGALAETLSSAPPIRGGTSAPVRAAMKLDLGSTARTLTAAAFARNPIAIKVGGQILQVTSSTLLTPAERLAAFQVFSTGQQLLQIGALGNAIGGSFQIGPRFNQYVSDLVVPHGVTAIQNAATVPILNLSGNLTNSGALYALSSISGITTAAISATNICNKQGGLISTVLPTTGLAGFKLTNSPLNLSLAASESIFNEGTIASSGSLSLSAGNSITNTSSGSAALPAITAGGNINLSTSQLVNSGLISSLNGNINLAGLTTGTIAVNNRNGLLQALNGNIVLGNAQSAEKFNIALTGGDLLSCQTDIFSGNGIVTLDANSLSGILNVHAGEAHVLVNSGALNLGTMDLSGDPTFYNTVGPITINSDLSFSGQDLALVAKGDITTLNSGLHIDTSGAARGGNITLIAGANFTSSGPASVPGTFPITSGSASDTTSTLTITSGSTTGGKIDLSTRALAAFNAGSSAGPGGTVNLIAFAGSGTGSGTISLPAGVDINTCGAAGNANGDVIAIAGRSSSPAITLGGISSAGTSTTGGGNILIAAATPVVPGSGMTVLNGTLTGSFTAGNPTSGIITAGSTGHDLKGTGSITISSGADIVLKGSLTAAQNLVLLAKGNLTSASPGVSLSTAGSGNAGRIDLVAGADFTSDGAGTLTITGGTATGGKIDLKTGGATAAINSSSSGGDGGFIDLIAFGGTGSGAGTITLPSTAQINASGSATGKGGEVRLIAGASSVTSISGGGTGYAIGTILSKGTDSAGNVIIKTAAPDVGGGITVNAGVVSGTFLAGAVKSGSVYLGDITAADELIIGADRFISGSIDITSGGKLNTGNLLACKIDIQSALALKTGNVGSSSFAGVITIKSSDTLTTGDIFSSGVVLQSSGAMDLGQVASLANAQISAGGMATSSAGITLRGYVLADTNLAIVASGSIVSTGSKAWAIGTGLKGGNAGNLNIVAGANFTASPTSQITISGASPTGGKIDLGAGTYITTTSTSSTDGNAGNVNIIAFGGSGSGAGTLRLLPTAYIGAKGAGTGTAGDITIIAGAAGGSAVSGTSATTLSGKFINTGATGTGNLTVTAATPSVGAGVCIAGGKITSGAFSPAAQQAGAVYAGSIIAGNNINISTQGPISTGFLTSGQAIQLFAGGLTNKTSNITVTGSVDAGSNLAIVASGNIVTTTGASKLDTSNLSAGGYGGSITLIAGAAFSTPAANSVTVSGGSATGGMIDLQNLGETGIITSGPQGAGNLTLIAFGGSGSGAGSLKSLSAAKFYANGGTGGPTSPAGNVTIIAGASTGAAISGGPATASGTFNPVGSIYSYDATWKTGTVTISAAAPQAGSGVSISGGSITSGAFTTGSLKAGSVWLTDVGAADDVKISTGGSLSARGIQAGYSGIFDAVFVTLDPGTGKLSVPPTSGLGNAILYSGGKLSVDGVSAGLDIKMESVSGLSNTFAFANGNVSIKSGGSIILSGLFANDIGASIISNKNVQVCAGGTSAGSNFTFSGILRAQGNLSIVASGNIASGARANAIRTGLTTGDCGAITLVAGAAWTALDAATIKITGATSAGGKIDLKTAGTLSEINASSLDGSAGTINLIAFNGSASGAGTIALTPGVKVYATGGGTGSGADITLIGGSSSGTGIFCESTDAAASIANGGAAGFGNLIIKTAKPDVGSGVVIAGGAVTTGTFSAGVLTSGSISTGTIIAGNAIDIGTGGSLTTNTIQARSNLTINAGGSVSSGAIGAGIEPDSSYGTGSFNLTAGGSVTTGMVLVANNLKMKGGGILTAGAITADSVMLSSTGGLSLAQIFSKTNLQLSAGGPAESHSNIVLSGNIKANLNIAAVASGNIVSLAGPYFMQAGAADLNQSEVTLVAGAKFSATTSGSVTITGSSSAGGKIDFQASTPTYAVVSAPSSGDLNGGNIKLIAFGGSSTGSGAILFPTKGVINANASGSGTAGDITLIAGAAAGAGFSIGIPASPYTVSLSIADSGSAGSGNVNLTTAQPVVGSGVSITDGKINAGAFVPGALRTGSISTGNITSTGNINVSAGTDLAASTYQAPGDLILSAGKSLSAVTLVGRNTFLRSGGAMTLLSDSTSNILATDNMMLSAGGTSSPGANITLFGTLRAGNNISVVASGNIASATTLLPSGTMIGSSTSSTGCNVAIVAGAAFTSLSPSSITITGSSSSGGKIDFLNGPMISVASPPTAAGGGNAGKIQMIALQGGSKDSGTIVIPGSMQIIADSASGAAGDVTLMAGGAYIVPVSSTTGLPVSIYGGTTTTGSGSSAVTTIYAMSSIHNIGTAGSGAVNVTAAKPVLPTGGIAITTGVLSGSFSSGSNQNGGIYAGPINSGSNLAMSAGNSIVLTGQVNIAGTINITAAANNGSIIAGKNVTSGGAVNLNTTGTGSISLSGLDATANSVALKAAGTGTINSSSPILCTGLLLFSQSGNIGKSTQDLSTSAVSLSANTGGTGSVYLHDSGSLILGASSAGTTFQLKAAGNINTVTLTAPAINLSTDSLSNGAITLGGNTGKTGSSVTLNADGSGNVSQSAGTLTGSNLSASSGTGNLTLNTVMANLTLTTASPGKVTVANTGAVTISGSSGDSVDISCTGAANLGNSNVVTSLKLAAAGVITTTGSQNAGTISLLSTTGGAISLNSNMTALSVTLNSSGSITQVSSGACINAATITQLSTKGDFGSTTQRIFTVASTINLQTSGQVWVSNNGDLTLPMSHAGTSYNVNTLGTLTTKAEITDPAVNLSSIGAAGGIMLGGNVGCTGASVSLSVAGTGDITQTAGTVTGLNLALTTGTGKAGSSALPHFKANATNVTVASSGGSAYIDISSATTIKIPTAGNNFNEFVFSSGGAITVSSPLTASTLANIYTSADAGITVNQSVTAPTVTLTTAGNGSIKVGANLGQAGGTTTLGAAGSGTISTSGTSRIAGATVILQTASGGVGTTSAPVAVRADELVVNAGGASFVSNGGNAGLLVHGTTGGAFYVTDSTGSLTVNGAITTGTNDPAGLLKATSNLTLIETGTAGAMSINGNLQVYGGSIVIQAPNTATAKITFGDGVSVKTLVDLSTALSNGKINIAVGAVPATPTNPGSLYFPVTVQIKQSGSGQAFAGAFPAALKGPADSATINAKGRNVIFSATSASQTVNLGSGVLIEADPPGVDTALVPAKTATGSNGFNPSFNPDKITLYPGLNQHSSSNIYSHGHDRPSAVLPGSEINEHLTRIPARTVLDGRTGVDALPAQIRSSRAKPGYLAIDKDGALFAPDRPLVINTRFGEIGIKKGAVVLVIATDTGVSLYNLHDARSGDITISTGESCIALGPGEHIMLTNDRSSSYGSLNPLMSISHRQMEEQALTGGVRVFRSTFSLPSAISGVKAIARLQNSTEPRERAIYGRLLKNAAILLHTKGPSGAFSRIGV